MSIKSKAGLISFLDVSASAITIRWQWRANARGVCVIQTYHSEEIVDGRPFATVPETENRQSTGIFLRLGSARYEDALCRY